MQLAKKIKTFYNFYKIIQKTCNMYMFISHAVAALPGVLLHAGTITAEASYYNTCL
jgi:hypothetical protein